jgi:hypothetical protein
MRHTALVSLGCVLVILAAAATARGQAQPANGHATAATYCPPGIEDQATTGCLSASSIPTLGMLYPLSNSLFVDAATGFVGIGTTTPTNDLDVHNGLLQFSDSANHRWLLEGSDRFQFGNNVVGDIFAVSQFGNIGIGTTSPSYRLTMRDGTFAHYGGNNVNAVVFGSTSGIIETLDNTDNFKTNCYLGYASGCDQCGYIAVLDSSFGVRAAFYIDPSTGNGTMYADVKNFRVRNPLDDNTDIWYACVEGPEAAAYVRGTAHLVHGRGVIALPDHFTSIVNEQGMTVQVTPLSGDSSGLAVTRKSLQGIEVQELQRGTGTYDFDYEVKAVRKGYEDYRVVRPRDEVKPALQSPLEVHGR